VSRRPLVTVPALTLADLLLWHWSLTAPHTVLAIVAGLTLPPLLVASMWLLAVAGVTALARGVKASRTRASLTRAGRARSRYVQQADALNTAAQTSTTVPSHANLPTPRYAPARTTAPLPAQAPVAAARERPPRKLAA